MPFIDANSTVPRSATSADYAELRRNVIAAGLLKRTYAYYLFRGGMCFALLLLAIALLFVLPATVVWTVPVIVLLGFALVQVALIGHDAGHLEVFKDTRKNWALGQLCWSVVGGIGFWYWNDRHNRHHGHTNDADEDPDIQGAGLLAITFTEREGEVRRGWRRTVARFQSVLIFLVLLLFAFAFRVEGLLFTLRQLGGVRKLFEVALLSLNMLLWVVLMVFLGWRGVGIFVGSQVIAGIYLGAIIAPNHKGMPVWAHGTKLSFLERQVLSSRNVTSHPVWDFLFGGLNYQIEHHLFPTMPRVHFKYARAIIKPFCEAHGLPYEEVDPLTSYRMVYAAFRRAGHAVA